MFKRVMLGLSILGIAFACSQDPTVQQLTSRAKELSNAGDLEAASRTYEMILTREGLTDSLRAKTLFALAENAGNREKHSDAIDYYQKIVDEYGSTPWGPKAQFMIGYTYANVIHDYKKAKQAYQRFLDVYPTDDLVTAVRFEVKYLGEDVSDITDLEFLNSTE
ncbi:MAG TPA: tetratricopeptide repeat protein [bacterium]|nr:tetratricopeptide repeat protein [bacterium]